MDFLFAEEFWREVGLTVAARLSVVGVALWAVKMITDHWQQSMSSTPRSATVSSSPVTGDSSPARAVVPEQLRAYTLPRTARRQLSLKKTESDSWREKMGKYLSGEPVVTSAIPRRQR